MNASSSTAKRITPYAELVDPASLVPGWRDSRRIFWSDQNHHELLYLSYRTTSGFSVVGEPLFSNQSMPSLTRSNFRR